MSWSTTAAPPRAPLGRVQTVLLLSAAAAAALLFHRGYAAQSWQPATAGRAAAPRARRAQCGPLQFSRAFGSHMVLQADDSDVVVWGTGGGRPGRRGELELIRVGHDGVETKVTTAAFTVDPHCRWRAVLAPQAATVDSGTWKLVLHEPCVDRTVLPRRTGGDDDSIGAASRPSWRWRGLLGIDLSSTGTRGSGLPRVEPTVVDGDEQPSCGAVRVTLTDVLFGDVYLCAGQSNMEFGLKGALGGEEEIAASGSSVGAAVQHIRLFSVDQRSRSTVPLRDFATLDYADNDGDEEEAGGSGGRGWRRPSPGSLGGGGRTTSGVYGPFSAGEALC
jgi:hypothetical protein